MEYDTRYRLLRVRGALMQPDVLRGFICEIMNLLRVEEGIIPEMMIANADFSFIFPNVECKEEYVDLSKIEQLSDAAFHKLVLFNINVSLLEKPMLICEMYDQISELVPLYPFPFHHFAAEIVSIPGCIAFLRDNTRYLASQFSLTDIITDRPTHYIPELWNGIRLMIPMIVSLKDVYLVEKQHFNNPHIYFWVYRYYYANDRTTVEGLIQVFVV
jgi:hypothetical protein